MNNDINNTIKNILDNLSLIDSDEIPRLDLYIDQITTFMDKHLSKEKRFEDDKILTKTMINNYAKNELLPPPEKKRYSKDHFLMLIFIYYFKNVLSINDIKTLLSPISANYFGSDACVDLDYIYKQIASLETDRVGNLQKDLDNTIKASQDLFKECDENDKDFLQLFSFIASLSFDIYVKKQVIESLIDGLNEQDAKAKALAKKQAAAKSQAKKDAKKEATKS